MDLQVLLAEEEELEILEVKEQAVLQQQEMLAEQVLLLQLMCKFQEEVEEVPELEEHKVLFVEPEVEEQEEVLLLCED